MPTKKTETIPEVEPPPVEPAEPPPPPACSVANGPHEWLFLEREPAPTWTRAPGRLVFFCRFCLALHRLGGPP